MKVIDFLNTCESIGIINIFQILETKLPCFDPEEDTEQIIKTDDMRQIPNNILQSKIQSWEYGHGELFIYI